MLYLAQRISAMIMAPLVLVHLALIVYAIQGGLDAAEILARTRGNAGWAAFYGLFVAAVSIHAAIGLGTICREWLQLKGVALNGMSWFVGLSLLLIGMRVVYAVISG